ncbi:hypothetical protein Lal_00034292, partial [Lupinus albus]
SVSPSISTCINWVDKADEVWEELKERFSQGNLHRIADLQESIASLMQGDPIVTKYFTEIKTLWDEYEIFRPLQNCTCDGKRCRLEDKIIRFLKGLNDSYAGLRSQIMLMDLLPTMSKVFYLVIQQERDLGGSSNRNSNTSKGFGKGNSPSGYARNSWNKPANSGKFCTHCKKPGHTIEVCYRLHGFPLNFQFTKGEQVNSAISRSNHESNSNQQEDDSSMFSLTKKQYQELVNILQHNNQRNSESPAAEKEVNVLSGTSKPDNLEDEGTSTTQWILDSGATDHICSNISCFSTCYKIRPIKVKLPNGQIILAKISGTIPISNHLIIYNALYLPSFSYNLLSIPKLTSQSSCILSFTASHCKIQERDSLKMIGIARISRGLYVSKGAKLDHNTNFSFINSLSTCKSNL